MITDGNAHAKSVENGLFPFIGVGKEKLDKTALMDYVQKNASAVAVFDIWTASKRNVKVFGTMKTKLGMDTGPNAEHEDSIKRIGESRKGLRVAVLGQAKTRTDNTITMGKWDTVGF